MPATAEASSATLHEPTNTCLERSFNTFEEGSADPWPACGSHCDVFSQVHRGAITKDFNLGLSFPQSKPLSVDTYNQGCLNPWGCVDTGDQACRGRGSGFDAFMDTRFRQLSQPLDPSQLEYHPPRYMMGVKAGGLNSVSGWEKTPQGQWAWQLASRERVPCPQR
jgi:hypothetical protein